MIEENFSELENCYTQWSQKRGIKLKQNKQEYIIDYVGKVSVI